MQNFQSFEVKTHYMRIINKILSKFGLRGAPGLKIGPEVEFINKGEIESKSAFLGFVDNRAVKISSRRTKSYFENTGKVYFGNNVRIHKGFGLEIRGELIVGDGTFINPNLVLYCYETIRIGSNCAISWDVTIMDCDLHEVTNKKNSKGINIGNDVWIGMGVKILKGVKIGNGSVVAAGAVVVKDIPENCLVAGNPAKIIKTNTSWR